MVNLICYLIFIKNKSQICVYIPAFSREVSGVLDQDSEGSQLPEPALCCRVASRSGGVPAIDRSTRGPHPSAPLLLWCASGNL